MTQSPADGSTGVFCYWAEDKDPHRDETNDEDLNITKNGFQIIRHQSSVKLPLQLAFGHEDPAFVAAYWPEVRAVLKQQFGARSVFISESRFRYSSNEPFVRPDSADYVPGKAIYGQTLQRSNLSKPFFVTHQPLSTIGARNWLRAMKPDVYELLNAASSTPKVEQEEFLRLRTKILAAEEQAIKAAGLDEYTAWNGSKYQGPRWAIVNVNHAVETVESACTGLLDVRTLLDIPGSFEERTKKYRSINFLHDIKGFEKYGGDNCMPFYPTQDESHKWWWLSDQKPDEWIVTKLFDSKGWLEGSAAAPFSPKCCFDNPKGNGKPAHSVDTWGMLVW